MYFLFLDPAVSRLVERGMSEELLYLNDTFAIAKISSLQSWTLKGRNDSKNKNRESEISSLQFWTLKRRIKVARGNEILQMDLTVC